jgi:Domain of unknown function (DUF1772)
VIEALQFVAVLSATSFAAIALYISIGEHPARMECGPELASFVFGPSYRRAARIQVTLALAATLSGAALSYLQRDLGWLVGTVLIFVVIPVTLIAILPTNRRLLDPDLDRTSPHTYELLRTWARLHGVRTLLSVAAAVLFLIEVWWPQACCGG